MVTIYLISNNITNKNFINDKNNDNIEFRIKKFIILHSKFLIPSEVLPL